MCFGKKDTYDPSAAGPRPASNNSGQYHQQQQQASYNGNNNNNNSMNEKKKSDYAPPQGPPPTFAGGSSSRREDNDDFAPPPGPPPPSRPPGGDFAPPPGPPPGRGAAAQDYAAPSGPPPSHGQSNNNNNDFAPPPGPPPSSERPPGYDGASSTNDFAPPPGPPPSHAHNDYAPPPGPPPPSSSKQQQAYDYAPPPGPPPSSSAAADKKPEAWEVAVPDTSLFPPPPDIFSGFDRSPANNATEDEANAGDAWCEDYPLAPPAPALDAESLGQLEYHNVSLIQPPSFKGTLARTGPGVWRGQSMRGAPDACLLAYPPLYAVAHHSPLLDGGRRRRTIYYEVKILSTAAAQRGGSTEVNLAMGFSALPYPAFRLPGWHRGSLAVHGDDGHRYINDKWGGKTFTEPFRRGETYGVGMRFSTAGPGEHEGRIGVEIFFTRGGRVAGSWDLHEETDAREDLPVTGLEGYHDLCAAVGAFEEVGFEVVFDEARWLYRGE